VRRLFDREGLRVGNKRDIRGAIGARSDCDQIIIVLEQLRDGTSRIEIISGFGIGNLRNERRFRGGDLIPLDPMEEGVYFDLCCALRSEPLSRVESH
jgi:hypothetical protein